VSGVVISLDAGTTTVDFSTGIFMAVGTASTEGEVSEDQFHTVDRYGGRLGQVGSKQAYQGSVPDSRGDRCCRHCRSSQTQEQ